MSELQGYDRQAKQAATRQSQGAEAIKPASPTIEIINRINTLIKHVSGIKINVYDTNQRLFGPTSCPDEGQENKITENPVGEINELHNRINVLDEIVCGLGKSIQELTSRL